MAIGSDLWSTLIDHMESAGVVAAFIGVNYAAYRTWVPNDVVDRNHARITKVVNWLSEGSWLVVMQRGVRSVLRGLQAVYGPRRTGSGLTISDYLTVRAWKMSAWIASFLIVVVPLTLMFLIRGIQMLLRGDQLDLDFYVVGSFMTAILATPFVATWKRIRTIDQFTEHTGIENPRSTIRAIVEAGAWLAIGPSVVVVMGLAATSGYAGDGLPASKLLTDLLAFVCFALIVVPLVAGAINATRRHGFLAPLTFVLTVVASTAYLAALLLALAGLVVETPQFKGLLFLPAGLISAFSLAQIVVRRHRVDASVLAKRFVWMVALLAIAGYFQFANQYGISVFVPVIQLVVYFACGFVAPYVVAFYAAIFSNAIPDWIGIAVTRAVLSQACSTTRLRRFAVLLGWDVACAALLCVLTASILIASFTLSGMLVEFAESILPRYGMTPISDFFYGAIDAPELAASMLEGAVRPSSMLSTGASAGSIAVIALATLSLTSLGPTLLNACVVVALIIAKVAAIVVKRPLATLHNLIVIDENTSLSERASRSMRSGVLIAALLSITYAFAFSMVWLLVRAWSAIPISSQ